MRTYFDKLPVYIGNTKFYAGIGSRKTPIEIKVSMTIIASLLEEKGYILRSGGALGADKAFEKNITKKEIFYAGNIDKNSIELKIARELHPCPEKLDRSGNSDFVWKLMARNTNQIFGKYLDSPVDFVLCWTPDGAETHEQRTINTGGTGQAISMASLKGIPVINMANENWKKKLLEFVDISF